MMFFLRFTKILMLKINTNVCAKMTARDTQQLGSLDDYNLFLPCNNVSIYANRIWTVFDLTPFAMTIFWAWFFKSCENLSNV
jgi:hypothetical protein